MRRPIVVAIANYILPGSGYVILGQRSRFGWLVLLGCVIQIIQLIIDPLPPYFVVYGSSTFSLMLGALALFTIQVAFGYDAYILAKKGTSEI